MTEKNQLVSYQVQYSNVDIAKTIAMIEPHVLNVEEDLLILSLIVMSLCISDPELPKDSQRFRNVLDSVSSHICWVLGTGSDTASDPKLMN